MARSTAHWVPRIAALLVAAFLSVFALDAFSDGPGIGPSAVLMHLLPSLLVLAIAVAAWRRPVLGAIGFAALAVLYATVVNGRVDWIVVISGPLLLAAALYVWSWRVA